MRVTIFTGLLLACLLAAGCAPGRSFDSELESIVRPYLFDFISWEFTAIKGEIHQRLPGRQDRADDQVQAVIDYFSAARRAKAIEKQIEAATADNGESDLAALEAELSRLQERRLASQDTVERIIERQVRETLAQQGIFNPLINLRVTFPPLNFKLERPPHLLVISPRDRIESLREITLQQDLTLEEIEDIEAGVDGLGVSSLIVELGGLSTTYPTFVTDDASLRFTIDTVAEEWLHHYLAFKPLGFLYLLDVTGVSRNYEIATINETLASIVSKEIGAIIYDKYYARYKNDAPPSQETETEAEFDFNREMREIRRAVDAYLARGEIEQAEEFMEEERQYLASMGYYIRKLNQAYFAFHGTYADRPTSISPIGIELSELRTRSPSLKDFLETVAAMTSHQHLRDSIR